MTPWTAVCLASLSFTISWSLSKLMSIESVMLFNHFIFCCPLLVLPSVFPCIRVFSSELVLCIRWSKYWDFRFSISPSNEYSGLISCKIDRFDFLAVQGNLKSLLQHHSWEASILWHAAFFMVQPSICSLYNICTSLLEKNHSFNYINLCWQNDVCFLICCLGLW